MRLYAIIFEKLYLLYGGNPFLKNLYLVVQGPFKRQSQLIDCKTVLETTSVHRPRSDGSYSSILQEQSDLGPH